MINDDGTYCVLYDTGEKEEHVSRASIHTTIEDSLWAKEWTKNYLCPSLKDVVSYYYRRFKHSDRYLKWKAHWSVVQAAKVTKFFRRFELALVTK